MSTYEFIALYNDNTSFSWKDSSSGQENYKKIDRSKLIGMEVVKDGKLIHRMWIEPKQRLILREKVMKRIKKSEYQKYAGRRWQEIPESAFTNERMIMIGHQETITPTRTVKSITLLFESGHSEHISEWKAEPAGEFELMQEEKTEWIRQEPNLT